MRIHQAILGTADDLIRRLGLRGNPYQARKYFVLSLHRAGTRSTSELLESLGIRVVHWPVRLNGWKELRPKIIGRETDLDFVTEVLKPVINKSDGMSDVPIPVLYRPLAERYPNARFILMRRNTTDWISSVRKHIGDDPFDPFERVQYWHYFPSRPSSITELSDEDLAGMCTRHYSEIRTHFATSDKTRFAEFHLEDPTTGADIAAFVGTHIDGKLPHVTDRPKRKRWYRRSTAKKKLD